MKFEGKVAVVTGSAQGIGEVYARRLAAEGAAVVGVDIQADKGEAVMASIREAGAKAAFVHADVTDLAACEAVARIAEGEFGGADFLVNNAAIFAGMRNESLMAVDPAYFDLIVRTNFTSLFLMSRAIVPLMIARGGGAIVNQSSTAAYTIAGVSAYYGITKLAVNGLTQALAHELGDQGIRVNSIAPGATETPALAAVLSGQIKAHLVSSLAIKRLATPDDMADALVFLLSDEAKFITGQVLPVDGGRTRRL
jgi:3-oxoacyl-[acyl-carrier protein] reductase